MGDASRDMLTGPGQGTWNLSINKDTKLGFLGESGSLQFRAEIFNLLNRANFSLPSGTIFNGTYTATTPDPAGPSEAPISGVAQIIYHSNLFKADPAGLESDLLTKYQATLISL